MTRLTLDKVLHTLRARHTELIRWLGQTREPEISLRLGPHPPAAVEQEVSELASAIDKGERAELGQCEVCHDDIDEHLFKMDYTASVCLEHLSADQRSRLESELEMSQKVQRGLLPKKAPAIKGWEIAAFSQPASVVGGDYFDFQLFGDKAQAIIIGDVMGKGMPASLLMANLQATLHIIVPESTTPVDVILRLNRLFHHNISMTKFVSLFIAHLDPATGRLVYVNAGHHPPFLAKRSNSNDMRFTPLRPTGPAIGLVEDPLFSVGEAIVDHGDILVLYTDGIVETRSPSGEEFGEDRLRNVLLRSSLQTVSQIAQEVQSRVHAHAGRPIPDDDATLIVCRRNGN